MVRHKVKVDESEVCGGDSSARETEVNAPDKSVLMDEFTSATRKRGSSRTPRQISVTRTERTSARVEREEEEEEEEGPVIGVKSILLFPKQKRKRGLLEEKSANLRERQRGGGKQDERSRRGKVKAK